VRTLAPPQLLAMKLAAWRDDLDIEDARLLLSKIAGDRDTVWEQVEPYLVDRF
jgi:predicted nucleotidyltransferase